ncbi:MAG: Rnase Y domain-containing protein [Bdellovibrionota bacterium]
MTIFSLVLGLMAGILITILFSRIGRANALARAENEAKDLLTEAKETAEHLMDESKLAAIEAGDEIWAKHEADVKALEERVKVLDEDYRKKRSAADRSFNQDSREVQKQMQTVQEQEKRVLERQERLDRHKKDEGRLRQALVAELKRVAGLEPDELKKQLHAELEQEIQSDAKKKAQIIEDDVRANSEEIAKKLIVSALTRFPRAACTERGIGIVEIPNDDVKRRMLGPDGRNIALLQELVGLEIVITDKNTFQVVGYDPVRREITTRCLEKLLHERAPNEDTVRRLFEKTKSDVARKTESDGNRIAAELGQKDLNPEIKKMLGALRYRYSFAQNQHFHVSEVGWLCGILAAELGGVDRSAAKRVGLLHDVGKAMDHNQEGGHAVLGADFIDKHGEKPHIVHAVRAHHYEEQPSTDLAFLVIAADAMSGARPGARRSTVTVYNQKIEALTTIAEGFKGVQRTLILSAGREVRVIVDGRRVNDEQSLKMCRQIADKIEEECQYPGQIKVVVIRETHAEARVAAK